MSILAVASDPEWCARALSRLDELLVDHAHCEKKAAGVAVRLIFQYPQHGFLHAPLSRLAREELRHFEEVLAQLESRGLSLRPQRPSSYAGRLRRLVRSAEPLRLLDTLLCCALIEARSCERFGLLAEAAPDADLAALWGGLRAAEARHEGLYVDLACRLARGQAPSERVRERLSELARQEGEILAAAELLPRMHSG